MKSTEYNTQNTVLVYSTQYTQQSTSTQCTVHSTQYTVHSTQYTVHCTKHTVHSTQYWTQYAIHSSQFTVQNTVQSTRFTVHRRQYTIHSTKYLSTLPQILYWVPHCMSQSEFYHQEAVHCTAQSPRLCTISGMFSILLPASFYPFLNSF